MQAFVDTGGMVLAPAGRRWDRSVLRTECRQLLGTSENHLSPAASAQLPQRIDDRILHPPSDLQSLFVGEHAFALGLR
ncbi:MAG: hypothetical protein JWM93_154 [Frankiales bacterium]|nr:hypothetical protein [Frankiales bacterium]